MLRSARFYAESVTLHEVITACGTGEQWKRALVFLEAVHSFHLRRTLVSYNAAIRACAKGAAWQHALHVLRSLQVGHLQGDDVSYRTAISACSLAWRHALALLHEAKFYGLNMGVGAFGAVMTACQAACSWDKALETFAAMLETNVQADAQSYTSAISSSVRSEDWHGAVVRLSSMLRLGIRADSIVQNAGIVACGCRLWHCALEQLARLADTSLQADSASYNAALSACEGNWRISVALWAEMEQEALKRSAVSVGTLLSGQNELAQDWRRPLKLLLASCGSSFEPSVISYTNVVNGMACSWRDAVAFFSAVRGHGVAHTLPLQTSALKALGSAGCWQKVMQSTSGVQATDLIMNHVSLSSFGSALQWRHVLLVFAMLMCHSLEPTVGSTNLAVTACAAPSQWCRSLELAGLLSRQSCNDVRTGNAALHAAGENGQWRSALALLQALARSTLQADVVSYTTAIAACGTSSCWQPVLLLLEKLEERRLEATTVTCNSAVSALGRAAQWQLAAWLLNHSEVVVDENSYDALMLACSRAEQSLHEEKSWNCKLFSAFFEDSAQAAITNARMHCNLKPCHNMYS